MSSIHGQKMVFKAAGDLADFANLTPAEVTTFREMHLDFAPPLWWDYQPDVAERKQWEITQKQVQDAWSAWGSSKELFLDQLLRLYTLVFNPENTLDGMLGTGKPAYAEAGAFAEMTPYHKAIEFLAAEPWRAKVCEECQKRFAANHPKRRYCSSECSGKAIESQHLKWGRDNNWGRGKKKRKKM